MNHQTKLTCLILFVLREILLRPTLLPCSKYDFSASLADWISNIFKQVEDSQLDTAVKEAFNLALSSYVTPALEYNITGKRFPPPFGSKIIFSHTTFHLTDEDGKKTKSKNFTLESWKPSDSKIRISAKDFRITLEGQIRVNSDQYYVSYWTRLHFKDFVLDATRLTKHPNDVKFYFEFSYKSLENRDYRARNSYWVDAIGWRKGDITVKQGTQLSKFIEPMLPLVLHDYMNCNPKFSEQFGRITKIYDQPLKTISANENLLNHRQQHYYLIPQTGYYGFYLRNVIIKGLLKIESLDVDKKSSFYTRTLLMKNIRGNMTLDYGCKYQLPLNLNYVIDYLSISIKNGTDLVHVEARSYSVNRTTGAPLTHRQSAKIIQKIECAVATALVPSKRAWKTCEMESGIDQIEITNATDWKKIEEKYGDWIPFNHDDAPKKSGLMRRILGDRFMPSR